jgi:hypothetical protein
MSFYAVNEADAFILPGDCNKALPSSSSPLQVTGRFVRQSLDSGVTSDDGVNSTQSRYPNLRETRKRRDLSLS